MSEQENRMNQFLKICLEVIPKRVSLITNHGGDWEDRIVMRGPHINISVLDQDEGKDLRIRISDERGLTVEIPCEWIEIIDVRDSKWEFEVHIYFFTFEGFARMNIIGEPLFKHSTKLI